MGKWWRIMWRSARRSENGTEVGRFRQVRKS